jgi:exopolysaccharide biosynthesis polyprenyl glycosylphosphotransferase
MSETVDQGLSVERALPRPAVEGLRLVPRLRWRATQVAADFVTVFLAAQAAYGAYLVLGLGKVHYDPKFYAGVDLALAIVTTFALNGYGAYRGQLGLLRIESVRRILKGGAMGALLVLAMSFFMQSPEFSRLHMLFGGACVVAALLLQRAALWKVQTTWRERRGIQSPVLIWGAGETGRHLAQQLMTDHALGLKPVGFLDDDAMKRFEEVRAGAGVNGERLRVLGTEDHLDDAIAATGARAVFLAMPTASTDRIASIVSRLEARGIPFFGVPNSGNLVFGTLSFGQIAGVPVFTRRQIARDPIYEAVKRALDVAGSALLLLLTSPLLLAGALAVRLSSPGPVFFSQERVGLKGRRFTIWKLRTMRTDSPKYALHPATGTDPRITPVGRWLRRTCVDELPQLWNVIRGDMSLVGPRPEMPFVVEQYGDMERQRLSVKPGVTGLWQISADRAFSIHDNMQYDLYYVEHRGLTLDLSIALMTPFYMMARDRAL